MRPDDTQRGVLLGMGAGVAWAFGLFVLGVSLGLTAAEPLALAFGWLLLPGLVLMVQVGRIAAARFLDPAIIDGQTPAAGSPADRGLRVLSNTLEQAALAALVWPALALRLPAGWHGVIPALAVGFVIARAAFAAGYARGAAARAFGFAATFYPTILAALAAIGLWVLV